MPYGHAADDFVHDLRILLAQVSRECAAPAWARGVRWPPALLGALAWAGVRADQAASRDEALFEIPQGTWARRMAGDKVEILPAEIRLTLGLNDVLLLRNLDDVPQIFGPTLMMPGQSFRLPFEVASSYSSPAPRTRAGR